MWWRGAFKGRLRATCVTMSASARGTRRVRPLYYYHAPSGSPELDFIASFEGEPTIIECKSNNGRATSMRYVLAHPKKYGVHPAIKFADTNVGGGEGFAAYPLYALGFLPSQEEDMVVEPVTIELA